MLVTSRLPSWIVCIATFVLVFGIDMFQKHYTFRSSIVYALFAAGLACAIFGLSWLLAKVAAKKA